MKNLYAQNCNGVFYVFGNRKVDLGNTSATNTKPVIDELADRLLEDFDGKYVFEVKEGEPIKEDKMGKYIPGKTPFVFNWETMPLSEIPADIIELGYEDKEWNLDTGIDRRTNKEIDVTLDGKSFMHEMDFIECNEDVEDEIYETKKEIDAFLKTFEDEDPKKFKGMKVYEEPKKISSFDYNAGRKKAKELGYKGENGFGIDAIKAFLKDKE